MSASVNTARTPAADAAAHTSEVSVELVDSLAKFETLQPDYERLHALHGRLSPFSLHEWHMAWYAHFLNVDARIRDRLAVLVVRRAGNVCALVPLVVSSRRFGPVHVVSAAVLGIDPSTTEHRAPLIEPGYERTVFAAVRARLTLDHDWDWIAWGDLEPGAMDALGAGRSVVIEAGSPGYVLDLAPTWDAFRAGLKRNIRESLRHCYNSLKRDGLEFHIDIVVEPPAVASAVGRFLELHDMRAQLKGAVEHSNHFKTEVARRFLYDVCRRLAERGILRVFEMRIGEDVVASRIGFVIGKSLFLYYSGFDPRWAHYSVMTTTVAEAIKYAITAGLDTVNLSRGTDTSKTRWGPRRVEYCSAVERRPRLSSQFAHHCYERIRSGKGLQGWLLRRLGNTRRVWS